MASSPDSYPVRSPDSRRNPRASLDSVAPDRLSGADLFAVGLGAAVDLFLAAKAAEGASPRTIEWYRYINGRAVRRFGADRPLDRVGAPELRVWLLELRETLSPESIAGFVRASKRSATGARQKIWAPPPGSGRSGGRESRAGSSPPSPTPSCSDCLPSPSPASACLEALRVRVAECIVEDDGDTTIGATVVAQASLEISAICSWAPPEARTCALATNHARGIIPTMKTTIDKAGRLVIPRPLRDRIGLAGGGEVELELDGAAIRIEPVGGSGLREDGGLLVIPASGTPLTAAAVRELIDADRHGR